MDRPQTPNTDPFNGQEIEFPVTYVLKVVVTNNMTEEHHKQLISEILLRKKIPFNFESTKPSTKGTYLSFSIMVTLLDKKQLEELYAELKTLPWIKMAI